MISIQEIRPGPLSQCDHLQTQQRETIKMGFSIGTGSIHALAVVALGLGSVAAHAQGALPKYAPEGQVQGTIRNFGNGLSGVLKW